MKYFHCNIMLVMLFALGLAPLNGLLGQEEKQSTDLNTPIFLVGKINRKPHKPDENLVEKEFKVFSSDAATVQVRKPEDFPQALKPEQRLAIFLGEPASQKYLFRAIVWIEKVKPGTNQALTVSFNKQVIWKRELNKKALLISALILPEWLEKGENVLQIQNNSQAPVCFDWISIKPLGESSMPMSLGRNTVKDLNGNRGENAYPLFGVYDLNSATETFLNRITHNDDDKFSDLPPEMIGFFNLCWNMPEEREFQTKNIYCVPAAFVEWIWSGGTSISIENLESAPAVFDTVSGKPKQAFYALKRIERLFDGNGKKIEFNVIPAAEDALLKNAVWAGNLNCEGVATLMLAAARATPVDATIICSLPWKGKTKLITTTGIATKDCPIKDLDELQTKTETIDIPADSSTNGGLFKKNISLSGCVTLRLVKEGVQEPVLLNLVKEGPAAAPHTFERNILQVSEKQPKPDIVREQIRAETGISSAESSNYSIKAIDATRGLIDGIKNVTPWNKKSELVEVAYPKGIAAPSEGVKMFIYVTGKEAKEFSFWVYPRSEANAKNVTLQLLYRNAYLAVDLKTDKWQRVSLLCEKYGVPCLSEYIQFLASPSFSEYKKGAKVSFEFNGFAVTGGTRVGGKASNIAQARVQNSAKDNSVILLGKPGDYAEYRHTFKEPVVLENAKLEKSIKEIKLTYKKDAQILEIMGEFPKPDAEISSELLALLTDSERNSIKDKGLTPLIIRITPAPAPPDGKKDSAGKTPARPPIATPPTR